jgi:L-aspartate oxidase
MLELAPRDVVTRAIFSEMTKNHTNNVYLNATLIGEGKILKRFPTITKNCRDNG